MAYDVDKIVAFIKNEPSLNLSPVARQLLVSRIQHEPTSGEIAYAREQITGRLSVGSPN